MNKIKQCTYTMILIFTCLIASPMIFKQIWTTSAEKKKENKAKIEDIDISKGYNDGTDGVVPPGTSDPAGTPSQPGATGNTPEGTSGTAVDGTAADNNQGNSAPEFTGFVQGDFSYFDNALFIGDSRTVGIREYGSLGNADFYCREGLSTGDAKSEAVSGDLANMLSSGKYKKIYIMLGINEIGNDIEGTFGNFKALVETVRSKAPDALIFVQANMHVSADSQTSMINNDRINALNDRISTLADKSTIFYININPVFDDASGNLDSGYTSDGVHVLGQIYRSWSEWYCQYTVPVEYYEFSKDNTAQ